MPGTRTPPSQDEALAPRNGVYPVSGHESVCGPLSEVTKLSLEGEGQMEPGFDDVEAALTEAQVAGARLEDHGVGDQHSKAGSHRDAPGRRHDGQKVGGQHLTAVRPDDLVEPADLDEGHQAVAI